MLRCFVRLGVSAGFLIFLTVSALPSSGHPSFGPAFFRRSLARPALTVSAACFFICCALTAVVRNIPKDKSNNCFIIEDNLILKVPVFLYSLYVRSACIRLNSRCQLLYIPGRIINRRGYPNATLVSQCAAYRKYLMLPE